MSTIRKQSLLSSAVVYGGFVLGFFNTYLFTREGGFSKEQYGLTAVFIAVANILFSIASLGMPAYVSKFFPYYKAHTTSRTNDQLTWALLLPCLGFLATMGVAVALKDVLIDRVFSNAPLLPYYFYWIFPFGFGYTLFMVLEAYAWQRREPVASNFLKEVFFRLLITGLILLTTFGIVPSFDQFIRLYAFTYPVAAALLLLYFSRQGGLLFTTRVSRVTRRFFRKILTLTSYVWGGGLVFNLATVFDTIVLTAVLPNGLAVAAVFTLAQNISSLIQAPQRAVISASVGPLSQAWKDKDYGRIQAIYQRSSINQLLFSTAAFCLIWLNFEEAISTFRFQADYAAARWAFFFIGLTRIIDMGTGVNSQIIGTSTFWRFEFMSGLLLLLMTLPLNYALTRQLGLVGPAVSNLISFTLYNAIRYFFLWNRFRMQPFTMGTLYTLLLAGGGYWLTWMATRSLDSWTALTVRTLLFSTIFIGGAAVLKLSPDAVAVLRTVGRRLGVGKET